MSKTPKYRQFELNYALSRNQQIVYYANMLAGVMESNTLREEPVVIASQLDPLGDALDHLYPLSSMKNSKQLQPDDPLGEN